MVLRAGGIEIPIVNIWYVFPRQIKRTLMGPPGFEPESMAPKATRINQATLRAPAWGVSKGINPINPIIKLLFKFCRVLEGDISIGRPLF